jgi:hypothetical protein
MKNLLIGVFIGVTLCLIGRVSLRAMFIASCYVFFLLVIFSSRES